MRLLILAGGFGSRLKTAIGDLPKALAPVAGGPFLRLQIENWRTQGMREFYVLLHHKADQIISLLESLQSEILVGCNVKWLVEPVPLETGGAIANAVRSFGLKGDFLVANADTWIGTGLGRMMQSSSPAVAVLRLPDVGRYGQVEYDQGYCVTRFVEKGAASVPGWINTGISRLNANLFASWDGQPFSLERVTLVELARARRLEAVPLKTDFVDIGIPDDYYRFCSWVEGGRKGRL